MFSDSYCQDEETENLKFALKSFLCLLGGKPTQIQMQLCSKREGRGNPVLNSTTKEGELVMSNDLQRLTKASLTPRNAKHRKREEEQQEENVSRLKVMS